MLLIERRVRIVADLTERARYYYDVFEFYEGARTRPYILDVMNDFYFFFQKQSHVHRLAMIVKLAVLFDKQATARVSVPALIKEAKSYLKNSEYNQLSTELVKLGPPIQKVQLIRNKALAHRDGAIDFNEVFSQAAVSLNDLLKLIEFAKDVADILCQHHQLKCLSFTTAETQSDLIRMFTKLGSLFPETDN